MEEKNEHSEHVEHNDEKHHTEHKEYHIHHTHHAKKEHVRLKKSAIWMMISGVLAVILVISIFTGGFRGKDSTPTPAGDTLSAQEAADKAVSYINTNLLQPGTTATVNGVEDSGDLYNIKLNIGGNEFDSYVTKDGGLLFPNAVDLTVTPIPQQAIQQGQPPAGPLATEMVQEDVIGGELPTQTEVEGIVEEDITGDVLEEGGAIESKKPEETPEELVEQ